MFLPTKIAALATSAVVFGGGLIGVTTFDKTVTLSVDGVPTSVSGMAATVQDVLRNTGVDVASGDLVTPALATPIAEGAYISVAHVRPVTLVVDGTLRELLTTALTVDAALSEAQADGFAGARVSVSRDLPLGREGLAVAVTTPKRVTLVVDGKSTALTTTAPTVGELLASQAHAVDTNDKASADLAMPVTDDMVIKVTQVSVSVKVVNEPVDYPVTKKKDATLWLGESRVISAGKPGKAEVTYEISRSKGKVAKKEIARTVLVKPTAQVLAVGTKTTGNGAGINLARAAMWDRIARCESGGRWSINTGNGYYGGLQFSAASWRAMGGRDFAALPHQASRAEQITVANRYYARAGLQPWSCRHAA